MPYLKDEPERKELDRAVDLLRDLGAHRISGQLNYVLFALCRRYVPKSYEGLRNFLAEIHEAECEIRRRILAPYEDQKSKENGDVI